MGIRATYYRLPPGELQGARGGLARARAFVRGAFDGAPPGPALHVDKNWDGLWYLVSPARRGWLAERDAAARRAAARLRELHAASGAAAAVPMLVQTSSRGEFRADDGGAAVVGSEYLHPRLRDEAGFARCLPAEQVAAAALLLGGLDREQVRRAYDPAAMHARGVYPDVWLDEGDEALATLEAALDRLCAFHRAAADAGEAVVVLAG